MSMTTAEILKPRLRGVLHTWAVPVAAVIGATLLMLANGARERIGTGVWAMTLTGLFAVSATYHRGTWRPAVRAWLQRVDHSMIFVFIAGS
ncbi:MAG: hemolysin III family protein, partial [Actinobacteria bacterium]|nr:hemolysin III family protein [Actinomycetota bacterium]